MSPHHILLEAAYADAATGLLDIARLGDFLRRIKGRIRHIALDRVSPLAVPVLLEMGREAVRGEAREALLREAADADDPARPMDGTADDASSIDSLIAGEPVRPTTRRSRSPSAAKHFIADMSGALFWPGERTLIVADLHLEKGSAVAARGQLLPPYDTRETLTRLAEAIDRYRAGTRHRARRQPARQRRRRPHRRRGPRRSWRILQEDRHVDLGHRQPRSARSAPALGGERCRIDVMLGGLRLQHEPHSGLVTHEIAGHLHPAARLSVHGHALRRPCFVGNGRRLVMPAFGAFTGGLNVLDAAFQPLFGSDGMRVWMLGQEGVYPVATRQLCGD